MMLVQCSFQQTEWPACTERAGETEFLLPGVGWVRPIRISISPLLSSASSGKVGRLSGTCPLPSEQDSDERERRGCAERWASDSSDQRTLSNKSLDLIELIPLCDIPIISISMSVIHALFSWEMNACFL